MSTEKLSLSKIYTSIFDEPLFALGFKRKGVLYYRLNGNVLQGVTLVKTSPYRVRFNMFPYWAYDVRTLGEPSVKSLCLGGWAEGALKDFEGIYFKREDPAHAIQNLTDILNSFLNIEMETMEYVKDEISYFSAFFGAKKWYSIPQKVVLRIAYLQNDFSIAETYLNFRKQETLSECYFKELNNYAYLYNMNHHPSFKKYADTPQFLSFDEMKFTRDKEKFESHYEYSKKCSFGLLEEKVLGNDLAWIDSEYKKDCEKMSKLLKEAFDIDCNS